MDGTLACGEDYSGAILIEEIAEQRRDVIAQCAWDWYEGGGENLASLVAMYEAEGKIRNGRATDGHTREVLLARGWTERKRTPQTRFVDMSEREMDLFARLGCSA